jgi:hypothetical protein
VCQVATLGEVSESLCAVLIFHCQAISNHIQNDEEVFLWSKRVLSLCATGCHVKNVSEIRGRSELEDRRQ